MKKTKYLLAIVLSVLVNTVFGQNTYKELSDKIQKANNSPMISYSYKMYLKNVKTGIMEDSITGRLYKAYTNYLDSNNNTLATCSKGYYCKIEYASKTALVFSVSDLKKKMGSSPKELKAVMIDLSDSIIARYGKMDVKELKNGDKLITISMNNQNITRVELVLDQVDMLLRRLKLEYNEESQYGDATGYKHVYIMDNFRYKVDENMLKLDRFFTVDKQKITLANKYAKYHLNTITN